MGIGGTGGYFDALSSEVLGAIDADAGLDGRVVSFIGITFRDSCALSAQPVVVSDIAQVALTGHAVVSLI